VVTKHQLNRERRLLLSWAMAGKDSKGRSKVTRSEGNDLGDSAARALMRHNLYLLGGSRSRSFILIQERRIESWMESWIDMKS